MSGNVILLDPSAPPRSGVHRVTTQFRGFQGSVVGFIDNSKPNFNYLVEELEEILTNEYGVKQIIKRRKTSASIPAPDSMLEELGEHCDLVITGSGD